VSIFAIVLGVLGFNFIWKNSRKLFLFLLSLSFVVLGIFFPWTLFYFIFFLAFLGAYGLRGLIKMRWESSLIKHLSLSILIIGLLFSSISFFERIPNMEPTSDQVEAFSYLKEISDEESVVFSHYSKGIWINSLSERNNVLDTNFAYAPDVNKRFNQSMVFLQSTDFDESKNFIAEYGIVYIYLDNSMRKSIWEGEDDGLLYLLKYSKQFKRVYHNRGIEIWRTKIDGN